MASSIGRRRRRLVLGNQALDDHDVAPDAVEPGVLLVDADLAKARPLASSARLAVFSTKTRETSFQKPARRARRR